MKILRLTFFFSFKQIYANEVIDGPSFTPFSSLAAIGPTVDGSDWSGRPLCDGRDCALVIIYDLFPPLVSFTADWRLVKRKKKRDISFWSWWAGGDFGGQKSRPNQEERRQFGKFFFLKMRKAFCFCWIGGTRWDFGYLWKSEWMMLGSIWHRCRPWMVRVVIKDEFSKLNWIFSSNVVVRLSFDAANRQRLIDEFENSISRRIRFTLMLCWIRIASLTSWLSIGGNFWLLSLAVQSLWGRNRGDLRDGQGCFAVVV